MYEFDLFVWRNVIWLTVGTGLGAALLDRLANLQSNWLGGMAAFGLAGLYLWPSIVLHGGQAFLLIFVVPPMAAIVFALYKLMQFLAWRFI